MTIEGRNPKASQNIYHNQIHASVYHSTLKIDDKPWILLQTLAWAKMQGACEETAQHCKYKSAWHNHEGKASML